MTVGVFGLGSERLPCDSSSLVHGAALSAPAARVFGEGLRPPTVTKPSLLRPASHGSSKETRSATAPLGQRRCRR